MDHFNYQNNVLHAEGNSIPTIASEVGTPFYCYSTATLTRHYNVFDEGLKNHDHIICFAVKANSNIAVLKTLAALGAGGDCVSEGEIRRCLLAGIDSQKIVFSGVGKTKKEIRFALENNILQINIESESELFTINNVAKEIGVKAPIAFRVNPDVDAGSHDKISTGRKEDKFGIAWDQVISIYEQAAKLDNINVQGVAVHIGSQLTELAPFKQAFSKVVELVRTLRKRGHNITHLDLGGGLGIPYNNQNVPTPEAYAKMVCEVIDDLDCTFLFEPGRLIAGNAGILVSQVLHIKETDAKTFVVIDAAMNDLLRPTLYDAYHEIIAVDTSNTKKTTVDIVGPICESGDVFAKNRNINQLNAGDLIAIRSAGAYGAVMASEYNSRPLIPEVLVKADDYTIIRKRPSYEQMFETEEFAPWQK